MHTHAHTHARTHACTHTLTHTLTHTHTHTLTNRHTEEVIVKLSLQGTLVEWTLNVGVYIKTLLSFRVAEGQSIPDDVSLAFGTLTII